MVKSITHVHKAKNSGTKRKSSVTLKLNDWNKSQIQQNSLKKSGV